MCALDIILGICFVLALVQGIIKGFTEQVVALVSIILGAWAAFKFSTLLCSLIQPWLPVPEKLLYVLVFILMVVAVIFALYLLGKIIKTSIKFVMLGWLDRLLGALFSIVKAALIIGIIIILFNTLNSAFDMVDERELEKSVLYTPLKNIAYGAFPYFKELLFK